MKKVIYYIIAIIIIIIILPMFIVKSCSVNVIGSYGEKIIRVDDDFYIDQENDIITLDKTNSYEIKSYENYGQRANIKVKVLFEKDNKVKEIDLEEYLLGVVAAEMPANFNIEALKAQAVAARTYTYGRIKGMYKDTDGGHNNADVCTNFAHCQAWIGKEEALKKWTEETAEDLWGKIVTAVRDTEDLIIVYNGAITNPVFHSTSGGNTENIEDVWDVGPVAYLRSVKSEGEENSPSYCTISNITASTFCKTLKSCYPDININEKDIFKDIKVLDYTEGHRVKTIKIGNLTFKGTDIRSMFALKSANFELEKDKDGMIKITTYGYGHGVGMSQWGANNLAKDGAVWEEIIKHYYTGVDIENINNIN